MMRQQGHVIPDNDPPKKVSTSQWFSQGYMAHLKDSDDVIKHRGMDNANEYFATNSKDGVRNVSNSELDTVYAATQQTDTLKQLTNDQVIALYCI